MGEGCCLFVDACRKPLLSKPLSCTAIIAIVFACCHLFIDATNRHCVTTSLSNATNLQSLSCMVIVVFFFTLSGAIISCPSCFCCHLFVDAGRKPSLSTHCHHHCCLHCHLFIGPTNLHSVTVILHFFVAVSSLCNASNVMMLMVFSNEIFR